MLLNTKPDKLHTYLYRPYQQLQVLGYRLAGKQCTCERHTLAVTPLGPTTRRQQLSGLLFPVAIFCLVLFLELALAGWLLWQFYPTRPWLIIPLAILIALPLSPYFYQVLFDTWRAYRLWKR